MYPPVTCVDARVDQILSIPPASWASAMPVLRGLAVEPERRRRPKHGAVESLPDDEIRVAVLLQLHVRGHEQEAPGEPSGASANDVLAAARQIPREADPRLEVVRVPCRAPRARAGSRSPGCSRRVEVVAQARVDGDARGRAQVGLVEPEIRFVVISLCPSPSV